MRFFTSSLSAAAFALLSSVVAAGDNPFTAPLSGAVLTAGQAFTVTWNPTAANLVTLTLRKGADEKNLPTLEVIAKDLPNNGGYIWVPSTELEQGTDYAIEITSDTPETSNYSPKFKIASNGKGLKSKTIEPSTTRSMSFSTTLVPSTATAGALVTGSAVSKAVATGSASSNSTDGSSDAAAMSSRSLPLMVGVVGAAAALAVLN